MLGGLGGKSADEAVLCDYHTNRLLVLRGTRPLAYETTGTEGGEETHPVIIITERASRQTTTLTLLNQWSRWRRGHGGQTERQTGK